MRYPETEDDNYSKTFIIADNSSEIAKILPQTLIEPFVILAKIKGYEGIDEYVIGININKALMENNLARIYI